MYLAAINPPRNTTNDHATAEAVLRSPAADAAKDHFPETERL